MSTRSCVLSVLSLCVCASAQFFNGSGEIQTPTGVDPSRFSVEISSPGTTLPDQRVGVSSSGRFELRNLAQGTYHVRVLDERGAVVGGTTYQAGSYAPLEIRVTSASRAQPVGAPRAVSVQSLRADPDGKADFETKYGLWEAKSKNWKSAAKHFEKALRIDERHTGAAANWAAMEFQRGDVAQAETIARRGLKYAPKNARLLHSLGLSILAQGRLTDEAVSALATAGAEIPKVLLIASQAEYRRGNSKQAKSLAEAYLASGDAEFRPLAQQIKALPDTAQ